MKKSQEQEEDIRLRNQFASAALQGILAGEYATLDENGIAWDLVAIAAFRAADHMMMRAMDERDDERPKDDDGDDVDHLSGDGLQLNGDEGVYPPFKPAPRPTTTKPPTTTLDVGGRTAVLESWAKGIEAEHESFVRLQVKPLLDPLEKRVLEIEARQHALEESFDERNNQQ